MSFRLFETFLNVMFWKKEHVLVIIRLHANRKVYATCSFNCHIETEGHLKVTGSHVHSKSDIVSETEQDGDVVTADRWYGLSNRVISNDLE